MSSRKHHSRFVPGAFATAFLLAGAAGDVTCGSWLTCTWDRYPVAATEATAVELAAGGDVTCVRLASGRVKCWGRMPGEMGYVDPIDDAARIFVGTDGTLAIVEQDGKAYCALYAPTCPTAMTDPDWGNFEGNYDFSWAQRDSQLSGSVSVAMNDRDTVCRIDAEGGATCWQRQDPVYDESGDYWQEVSSSSSMFGGEPRPAGIRLTTVAVATYFACALTEDRRVYCWWLDGAPDYLDGPERLPWVAELVPDVDDVVAITANGDDVITFDHVLVLDATGAASSLAGPGENATPLFRASEAATQIAASGWYVCVLLRSGRVECAPEWTFCPPWAAGCGIAASGLVEPLENVVEIAAGTEHACALIDDGSVWCWGSNEKGQLGRLDPSGGEPQRVKP